MGDDSIPKQVLKNLGQIVAETGKDIVKETGLITESVITGKELLGDIKALSPEEEARKRQEEQIKKEREMAELRREMSGQGRDVEKEIEEIRREKERKEKEEEEQMLNQLKQQREAEEAERAQMSANMGESSNPAKRKKSRGSAFVQGKKKSQMPDQSQMSQTSEFKGKID